MHKSNQNISQTKTPSPCGDGRGGDSFPWFPKFIATSFGAGFLPVAPGTWGALVAIVLWLPLYIWGNPELNPCVTFAAAAAYCFAGVWASNIAEQHWGKDPVVACADETVGQWIALIPVMPLGISPWWMIVIAFVLFRFFDIVKPLGIRRLERIHGGWGMMLDDIVAGVYSAIIVGIINAAFFYA